MKIGIISDIHSNKDALYAVLNDMEKKGIDKIMCLGDMVAKYIYPREVIEALKNNCDILIKGNCDQNVVKNENFRFARAKLGLENIEYIDSLPFREQLIYQSLILNLFHATPDSIDKIYNPLLSVHSDEMLIGREPQINFAGHTHIPYINLISPHKYTIFTEGKVIIDPNEQYIVNAGSVGEPLNMKNAENNWLISENMNYIILNIETKETTLEIVKVPYKNLLIKVYGDFIKKQQPTTNGERFYPRSPKDSEKIYNSLNKMGVNNIPLPNEIDKELSR